jgi:hypothetical protein
MTLTEHHVLQRAFGISGVELSGYAATQQLMTSDADVDHGLVACDGVRCYRWLMVLLMLACHYIFIISWVYVTTIKLPASRVVYFMHSSNYTAPLKQQVHHSLSIGSHINVFHPKQWGDKKMWKHFQCVYLVSKEILRGKL